MRAKERSEKKTAKKLFGLWLLEEILVQLRKLGNQTKLLGTNISCVIYTREWHYSESENHSSLHLVVFNINIVTSSSFE
jgi:hypothetical protein